MKFDASGKSLETNRGGGYFNNYDLKSRDSD